MLKFRHYAALVVVSLLLFTVAESAERRRTAEVDLTAPRAPLTGWMVAPDPSHTWTLTATTAGEERPWGDAAWLVGNGFGSGAIHVNVWRFRNGVYCRTQTLAVAARPNASATAIVSQAAFLPGDLLMLEALPAFTAHFTVTSPTSANPILDAAISTVSSALPQVPSHVTVECEGAR